MMVVREASASSSAGRVGGGEGGEEGAGAGFVWAICCCQRYGSHFSFIRMMVAGVYLLEVRQ